MRKPAPPSAERRRKSRRVKELAERYAKQFAPVKLFTIDDTFGGWEKAQKTHFADGGVRTHQGFAGLVGDQRVRTIAEEFLEQRDPHGRIGSHCLVELGSLGKNGRRGILRSGFGRCRSERERQDGNQGGGEQLSKTHRQNSSQRQSGLLGIGWRTRPNPNGDHTMPVPAALKTRRLGESSADPCVPASWLSV